MTDAQNPILSTHGLTKRFFGTLALDDIDFDVVPGEIHALIGENGAEKSTVIKVLAGVHQLDGGTIVFDGATVDPVTQRLPIAFVHQDLGLVEELSIGENVALVAGFPRRHGLIDWVRVWQRAREIYRLMEVDGIDPRTSVRSLDAAGKAVLGIVRALALQARVIVLDEPTAALPEPDVQHLLRILRTLRAGGTSIVYVSHRLGELFDFADRITVLRDGRTVRTVRTEDVTPSELVEDMLGHAVTGLQQASQVFHTHLTAAKDLMRQPRPDCFARVDGHHGASAVPVMEKMVAPLGAHNGESASAQRGQQHRTRDARTPAHAAMVMRWMPTNSRFFSGVPST